MEPLIPFATSSEFHSQSLLSSFLCLVLPHFAYGGFPTCTQLISSSIIPVSSQHVPDPESDLPRAASPTVTRLLATVVTDPYLESTPAFALVTEVVEFAARSRLYYVASLCLAAALPRFASMLLCPEGDPDALDIPSPRSYTEAIAGEYSSQWQTAMDAEMASWKSTCTYVDEVPPPGANIVDGMWIFRGVDFFQTFSPTPKMTTLRVLKHVIAQCDYELHSLDFSTAFLQGSLHEEIWLRRPHGFTGLFPASTQWSLRRPVYSLRQAPRDWHKTLRTTLAALGFAPSSADPSLFLRTDTTLPPFYVLVYVDDLFFASADTEALALVKAELQERHTCTDLEPSGTYPELVGCLMYLMTCTRPDLAYPLSLLARYVAPGRHRKVHWDAAKRVLRYLCSISGMGLMLGGRGLVVLTGHSDASWANEQATLRSSEGYTFRLGSDSVSWRSTRCSSVLGSRCEAKIYAGDMAAQELRWPTYLLTGLGERPRSPPVLYVDNKAMIALCQEHRTKHIALRYFLARELQQRRQLRLSYVASRANTANVFTKALGSGDHQRLCTALGLPLGPLLLPPRPLGPSAATAVPAATATTATAATTAATAAPACCATMASLRVLAFDHEGRSIQFDTWLDDPQLYLLSDSKDSVSLFDLASGAATAPPATADSATRSQTTQALYDAVVARYSSPATAALGRLLLPYLFPELSAFATVEDLVSHLRTSDARYRASVPAEFLDRNQPPMFITLYFIVTRLPDSLRSVKDHSLSLDPSSLTINLLEQHLLAAETSAVAVGAARGTPCQPFFEGCLPSPLAPSYASAATADVPVAEDVGAGSASAKRRSSKGGRTGGGGSGGGGGGSGSGGGGSNGTGGGSGGSGGSGGGSSGSGGSGSRGAGGGRTEARHGGPWGGQRQQQQRRSETQLPQQLREWLFQRGTSGGSESCPNVIRTDFDAILSAMYALSVSAKGDSYRCVPPDPGIAAAALGASESGTLPGTAPAQALHTFKLDLVVAHSSTVLPCPAVPSGSLSGLHLPSFSTNLVSTAALQDAMVTTTTPGGQRVSICTCTRTGRHLATFTHRPGSRLYTLATEPPQVAASSQVSASGPVAASCSCRLLSHQNLLWHHRLGHPSLPRLLGMHSRILISGLPRSLPPPPPSPAPPCLPCVKGRKRASPHSSSFPPTTAPLHTLHMDVWGPARVSGQGRKRYFLLVVDEYTRYTTVFPLRSKGQVMDVLIPWICAVRLQHRERFHQDLPLLRQHSDIGALCLLAGDLAHTALDRGGWRCVGFCHPTTRRLLPSQDVTFDELVPFYRLFPYRSAPPPPPPLFLAPGPPPVDPLPPQGPAPSGVSHVDPLLGTVPVEVAVGSVAARGAACGGAASGGAESEGAGSWGVLSLGVLSWRVQSLGVLSLGVLFRLEVLLVLRRDCFRNSCVSGLFGAHAFGVELQELEALETLALEVLLLGVLELPGLVVLGMLKLETLRSLKLLEVEALALVALALEALELEELELEALAREALELQELELLTLELEPPHCLLLLLTLSSPAVLQSVVSRPVSPVRTACRVPRLRPPPVPGTHTIALRPSSVPLRVPLPAPLESSLPKVSDPESNRARAASPTVSCLLATAITDPPFESAAASALIAELLEFAAACCLDYAIALVAESASASAPFIRGECALGTDVLEDRQEDFECLAAAVPCFASMLLAPEGDPDAPDIPTPHSYAKAIMGPYSSQWQAAMDAEMASWKSTGTYVDEVPPPGANIVDGMWIFR
ncbi:unnamed protein product, partial [Closterium sp. NIES-53]